MVKCFVYSHPISVKQNAANIVEKKLAASEGLFVSAMQCALYSTGLTSIVLV